MITSISPVRDTSVWIGVLFITMPIKNHHYREPHRHKGRYFNHSDEKYHSFLVPSLTMLVECYWNSFKKKEENIDAWFNPTKPIMRSEELAFTWIGHSTFLIQAGQLNILTDPIFSHLPLFNRQTKPGLEMAEVPEIDYVIISHNHRDHMDENALTFFKNHKQTHFLVPQGNKRWFEKRGFERVSEYSWWDRASFKGVTFTFLPAHHWAQRSLFDFNASLWGSWMISFNNKNLYFAGDTAYAPHFSLIQEAFPTIHYAFLPIGPCEPRRWMSYTHVSAEEAGQAFLDLNAHCFVPMHWGTYSFGTDTHAGPYDRLVAWWQQQSLTQKLITLKIGERHSEQPQIIAHLESGIQIEQVLR